MSVCDRNVCTIPCSCEAISLGYGHLALVDMRCDSLALAGSVGQAAFGAQQLREPGNNCVPVTLIPLEGLKAQTVDHIGVP